MVVSLRLVVVLLLLVLSFFIIRPFIIALLTAALLAYLCYPVYQRLLVLVKRPWLSALLTCGGVFLLIVIPTFFLTNTLVRESYTLYQQGKQFLTTELFEECQSDFCLQLVDLLGNEQLIVPFRNALSTATQYLINAGSAVLVGLPQLFVNIFIFFFALYYLLIDGKTLVNSAIRLFLPEYVHREQVLARFRGVIRAVLYGQVLVAGLQGIVGAVGFFLFGIPSPLFWGLIMAILAFLPAVGTGLIWGPAALVFIVKGLVTDTNGLVIKGILLALYGFLLISGIDNVLKPRLVGKISGVHPVVIVLGIFGGLYFLGILGVVLGPLILALTMTMGDIYLSGQRA